MRTGPLAPPHGGEPAPLTATLTDGQPIDLLALATRICLQYRREFPDERQKYGAAGHLWCVHDNQHLLNWAVEALIDELDMRAHVAWLARVLQARDFPVTRLARGLQIGAALTLEQVDGVAGQELSAVLDDAAMFVLAGNFEVDQSTI